MATSPKKALTKDSPAWAAAMRKCSNCKPPATVRDQNAAEYARRLAWNPGVHKSRFFSVRWNAMAAALRPVLEKVNRTTRNPSDPDDLRWLRDNMPLLGAELGNTRNAFKRLRRLPHVRT